MAPPAALWYRPVPFFPCADVASGGWNSRPGSEVPSLPSIRPGGLFRCGLRPSFTEASSFHVCNDFVSSPCSFCVPTPRRPCSAPRGFSPRLKPTCAAPSRLLVWALRVNLLSFHLLKGILFFLQEVSLFYFYRDWFGAAHKPLGFSRFLLLGILQGRRITCLRPQQV